MYHVYTRYLVYDKVYMWVLVKKNEKKNGKLTLYKNILRIYKIVAVKFPLALLALCYITVIFRNRAWSLLAGGRDPTRKQTNAFKIGNPRSSPNRAKQIA